MKIVSPAIYELLKGLASGRVYLSRAPQNAPAPFIVFQKSDSERWGGINKKGGIAQAIYRIDAYAETPYESQQLGADIEEILDKYRGTVYYGADSPQAFVRIGGISLQGEGDIIDETEEPLLFRNTASYTITYEQ